MDQVIAHLDLDAFYATVELHRRPDLRGLPVIVAGSGPRAVVTTASYEARKYGIGSAMPASQARRLCPEAVVVAPDFEAYRSVSRAVMELVREAVDTVEVVGLDEAYLDLSGLLSPHAAMRRLVADIRARTGMSASIGIGPNKLVAKVASDAEKPGGFVVLSAEEARARFAGAAPGLLPGIGPKTATQLESLGITTLAALAAAEDAVLRARFGARLGPWLRARALFEDDGRVTPVRAAVSESRETTFDYDVADGDRLEQVLRQLTARLCEGLAKQSRFGRTIAIKVRLDDWTTVTRARTVAEPTNDVGAVSTIAIALLREYAPPRPVRLIGVRVAGFADPQVHAGAAAGQLALEL